MTRRTAYGSSLHRPQREAGNEPVEKNRAFRRRLDDTDLEWLRVQFTTEGGRVTAFTVQYEPSSKTRPSRWHGTTRRTTSHISTSSIGAAVSLQKHLWRINRRSAQR